jgi:hypothetical protein
MTGGSGAKDSPHTLSEEERAPGEDALSVLGELERRELLTWVGEHLPELRQTAVGERPVLLDPRDRLRLGHGGVCRWIRAQIVGDDGAA